MSFDVQGAFPPLADPGPDRGLRARHPEVSSTALGKFVTTASLHLTVEIRVPELPREGRLLRAQSASAAPGGGYVIAAAARAQGVESWVASPLGTGPNSHLIRRQMAFEDVHCIQNAVVGDVGVGLSMVERDGKTASVIAPGIETETSPELLQEIELNTGDIVHISGGDLIEYRQSSTLAKWGASLPDGVRLVLSVSPAVDLVSSEIWEQLFRRADIVSMNAREAGALQETITESLPGTGLRHLLRPSSAIVRRAGAQGCEIQASLDSRKVFVPAYQTNMVDTAGVGDTHVAVMCASLLLGCDLQEACLRANAAGALAVRHRTALPVPTRKEVDEVILTNRVPMPAAIESAD